MKERDPRSNDEEPAGWLEAWETPAARPVFREALRAAFVSGESRAASATGAEDGLTDLRRLEGQLAPLLGQLDAPAARPAFVQELREEFVGGRRGAPVSDDVPHLARSLSLRWRLLAGGLAAAAAAWFLLVRPEPLAPPVPSLQLVPGSFVAATGPSVDGVALAEIDPDVLRSRMRSGATVSTGDSPARFRLGDYFVLELAPNSDAELVENAETPGAEDGTARDFVLRTGRGAVRVATGPAFEGSHMVVQAPFLEVEVVGTVFGIDVFDGQATCLCCIEGRVEVHPLIEGHDPRPVTGGWSSLVGEDFANQKPMPDEHGTPLEQLAHFWDRSE